MAAMHKYLWPTHQKKKWFPGSMSGITWFMEMTNYGRSGLISCLRGGGRNAFTTAISCMATVYSLFCGRNRDFG